jgi:hypothetical protein
MKKIKKINKKFKMINQRITKRIKIITLNKKNHNLLLIDVFNVREERKLMLIQEFVFNVQVIRKWLLIICNRKRKSNNLNKLKETNIVFQIMRTVKILHLLKIQKLGQKLSQKSIKTL